MFTQELQILKVEGLEPGATCRVHLDNEELPIKNSQFSIPRSGVVHFEFYKNRQNLGGVLFSTELLSSLPYQYIPIYSPAVFIDNFPSDIDPPRVLVIQNVPSVDTSEISSKCETIMLEESMESMKNSMSEAMEHKKELKDDIDFYKKVIGNERNIAQAKIKDLNIWIEASNFKSLMIQKNKDFVIKDLQSQRERPVSIGNQDFSKDPLFEVLFSKILADSSTISQLKSDKNDLLSQLQQLESENKRLKTENLKQELNLKRVVMKENYLRKEFESKKLFEKLNESRVSDQLREKNSILKSKLESCQTESRNFKEKLENTEKSYKTLKECLLGSDLPFST